MVEDDEKRWTSVELNDELIIRYTKQGDKLPLSTFEVTSGIPCMDSDSQVSSAFYPIELNRAGFCPLEEVTNETYDPRYSRVDNNELLQFGEWDIMEENFVSNILMSLPSYAVATT